MMASVKVLGADGAASFEAELLSAPSKRVAQSQHSEEGAGRVGTSNIGWVTRGGGDRTAKSFVAVVAVEGKAETEFEEVTRKTASVVWKRPKMERIVACRNRTSLKGGIVVPCLPEKLYTTLAQRHHDHEALKEAVEKWWSYRRDSWLAEGRSKKFPVMFKEWGKAYRMLASLPHGLQWFSQVVTRMELRRKDPEALGKRRGGKNMKNKSKKRKSVASAVNAALGTDAAGATAAAAAPASATADAEDAVSEPAAKKQRTAEGAAGAGGGASDGAAEGAAGDDVGEDVDMADQESATKKSKSDKKKKKSSKKKKKKKNKKKDKTKEE